MVKILAVFLIIVVLVTGVCLFIVFDLSSIIGYIGLVGISWRAGSCTYRRLVRFRCVESRAGTSIFGRFAGLGGGPVRVSCPFGFVLACVCVIEQVGGGWRGSAIF